MPITPSHTVWSIFLTGASSIKPEWDWKDDAPFIMNWQMNYREQCMDQGCIMNIVWRIHSSLHGGRYADVAGFRARRTEGGLWKTSIFLGFRDALGETDHTVLKMALFAYSSYPSCWDTDDIFRWLTEITRAVSLNKLPRRLSEHPGMSGKAERCLQRDSHTGCAQHPSVFDLILPIVSPSVLKTQLKDSSHSLDGNKCSRLQVYLRKKNLEMLDWHCIKRTMDLLVKSYWLSSLKPRNCQRNTNSQFSSKW